MTDLQKTIAFVAAAAVFAGAAAVRLPGNASTAAAFDDQGKPFFPEFNDPTTCTTLEVIDFDASTATPLPFQVTRLPGKPDAEQAKGAAKAEKPGLWTIPSHYNYPADAKDRLAKTAAGVIDLTKDTIRSDRAEDHETLGVVDPLDAKTTSLKGRGKRVTLKDASDRVLADFIIGNEVRERPGQRYVRVPGQKRTYGVNVKVELSTKFSDWIETNLLKLEGPKIRKIVFDGHKVDPDRMAIIPGEKLTIERKDASSPWTFDGELPSGQELNGEKLQALVTALGDLKIVGVRPKPPGLSRDLKAGGGEALKLTQQVVSSLGSRGFYPTKAGDILSNEGDVKVYTEDGAVYTLRYGEVSIATGEALSAGDEDTAPAKDAAKPKDKSAEGAGAADNRYLMVTVAYDPSLVPPPPAPPEPPLELPENVFQLDPGDPKRIAEEKAAKDKADEQARKVKLSLDVAQKTVQGLSDRFADWYYVTPGDSFRGIALDRAALIRPKSEKPEGAMPPGGGQPSFPLNLPGMGGHP
ncbi:DUF4340 domain-containing protein [Isosphaeraceae bacterium EP7]